ncbi:hypothetical protein [Aliikangiella sp. IMCC44359]|uniref:hypothetical protein n=1 Tax=Aliikangiella sp. IMCC44359 TaxID=3459125 RepID=UPI00403AB360
MNILRLAKLAALSVLVIASIATINLNQVESCGSNFTDLHRELIQNLSATMLSRLEKERSVRQDDICRMSYASLNRAITKLSQPKPDHPGEAKSFRYQQQLSENNQVNIENWQKAQQQVKSMSRYIQERSEISPNLWQSIGPGNIGGRIRSFAFDPDNSERIYAGAVSGGVWLTENAGQSWSPTDDFMANLSISTLIFDPNNSNIIYAGTGEGTFNVDQIRGLGIFKSEDKGVTWSALSSTQNSSNFYWVNRLTMLNNSSLLLAATHTGIWASGDAGISWVKTHNGRTNDIDVHPTDNNKLIAGKWGQALYSNDGGQNWSQASGLDSLSYERIELAYAPSNPNIVYASIDKNSGEIWKSSDGGQSYSLVNSGKNFLGSQGWYANALWIDPFNENQIIVGGLDLWKSNDSGNTLNKISRWWLAPSSAHADHHFILEHPDYDGINNNQVYFANDGGIYTAPDIQKVHDDVGWQELNNQLAITQFYGVSVGSNGKVVGGTQDNGTLIYHGDSENWTEIFSGDGGFSAFDPIDPNYIYSEYVHLKIHRSINGGNTSEPIYDQAMTAKSNFIAPFMLDPNNEKRMLAGSHQLWVSNNVKQDTPEWQVIKSPISNDSPISTINISPANSDIIYVGHNNGALYKTDDGTDDEPEWQLITTHDLPHRFLTSIAIDPINTDTLYISFGGYEDNNLWKSTDAGATWITSSGSGITALPSAPIKTISVHPIRNNQIYVGTEVGIFSSEDYGETWSIENNGPANVSVDELTWHDTDTLYAATHGRGVFKAKLSDDIPHTINFTHLNNVERNILLTTKAKTITGIRVPVNVSITNGEYSIGCTDVFTSANSVANNGDTICLRHISSENYWTSVETLLDIGAAQFTFSSHTLADTLPDAFQFQSYLDAELNTYKISNEIMVSGISHQVNVSVNNGEYSIGCLPDQFTAINSQISNGETICVRHKTSDKNLETITTELTLGKMNNTFTTTTIADTLPADFTFRAITRAKLQSLQTSAAVTITDFQIEIPIAVSNGEYSIGCVASEFTQSNGRIKPNDTVCVRHISSENYDSQTVTHLNVNGVTGSFISTTDSDRKPDSFEFNHLNNVQTSTEQISNAVTITGISTAVNIQVTGGKYSVGCTDFFTSQSSVIANGSSVCVKHTSSSLNQTQVQTTLTVGSLSSRFTTTTKAKPKTTSGGGSLGVYLLLLLILGQRKHTN